MGYSDQKFWAHVPVLMADSSYFTLNTSTASSTATVTSPIVLPRFTPSRKVAAAYVIVKTSPSSNLVGPILAFVNGTTTFCTINAVGTQGSAGAVLYGTFTNTASLSTNTQTITASNGLVTTNTITTTTNWSVLPAGTAALVYAINTSTVSGGVMGAYELWFDTIEVINYGSSLATNTYQ